jgi:hypothetical protein
MLDFGAGVLLEHEVFGADVLLESQARLKLHFCYSTALGIPSTSEYWPMPCYASLLTELSRALLLYLDLLC